MIYYCCLCCCLCCCWLSFCFIGCLRPAVCACLCDPCIRLMLRGFSYPAARPHSPRSLLPPAIVFFPFFFLPCSGGRLCQMALDDYGLDEISALFSAAKITAGLQVRPPLFGLLVVANPTPLEFRFSALQGMDR